MTSEFWRLVSPDAGAGWIDWETPVDHSLPLLTCPVCGQRWQTPDGFLNETERKLVRNALGDAVEAGQLAHMAIEEFKRRLKVVQGVFPALSVAPGQYIQQHVWGTRSKPRGDLIAIEMRPYHCFVRKASPLFAALEAIRPLVFNHVVIGRRKQEDSGWVDLKLSTLPNQTRNPDYCAHCWSLHAVAWPPVEVDDGQPRLYLSHREYGVHCNAAMKILLEPLFREIEDDYRPYFTEARFDRERPTFGDVPLDPMPAGMLDFLKEMDRRYPPKQR